MCHHSILSLVWQPWQWELLGMYVPRNFSECVTWSVYVFLWCVVVVYYVEEMESLPIHITNASLTNDISSKLEFGF